MLHQPIIDTNHRPFCGPLAIATLTGVPISRIEYMIRRCRKGKEGKQAVRRVWSSEVKIVLRRLGCKITPRAVSGFTLGSFIEDTKHTSATYLVNVPGHFLVTHKGTTAEYGTLHATPDRPQRRVRMVWKIEAPAVPKYSAADLLPTPPKRAPKPKPDIKQVRYQRVLARIKQWEAKEKRAKTALKKLQESRRYYEKIFAAEKLPPPTLNRPVSHVQPALEPSA